MQSGISGTDAVTMQWPTNWPPPCGVLTAESRDSLRGAPEGLQLAAGDAVRLCPTGDH